MSTRLLLAFLLTVAGGVTYLAQVQPGPGTGSGSGGGGGSATVISNTADVVCAVGSDTTVFLSGYLNQVLVTPGTDNALPNTGTWTTTGGGSNASGATGTFTASGGNLVSMTITNGGQRYTAQPTVVFSSGTRGTSTVAFSSCVNTTNASSLIPFQTTWTQPAGYWSTPGTFKSVHVQFVLVTSGTSTLQYQLVDSVYGLLISHGSFAAMNPYNGLTNVGFSFNYYFTSQAMQPMLFVAYVSGSLPVTSGNYFTTSPGYVFYNPGVANTTRVQMSWTTQATGNAWWLQSWVIQ